MSDKECVLYFCQRAFSSYQNCKRDEGQGALYQTVKSALRKYNVDIEAVVSGNIADDLPYDKIVLQILFDAAYASQIAEDCRYDNESEIYDINISWWREQLNADHAGRIYGRNQLKKADYEALCKDFELIPT